MSTIQHELVVRTFLYILVFGLMPGFCLRSVGDTLTIYAYPSPRMPDWSSPRKILLTTVRNGVLALGLKHPHTIGHVNVELQCDATETLPPVEEFVGTVLGKRSNLGALVFKGYGMGLLFHTFPGQMQSAQQVRDEIAYGSKSGQMTFVRFKISSSTGRRLVEYLREYRERGLDQKYGLPNRPLYGEGAGCSAFAISFLEVGGLLDERLTAAWSLNLKISKTLIGGPLTGRRVSPLKMLFSGRPWLRPGEAGREIFFWEPNWIHAWVLQGSAGEARGLSPALIGKARGLTGDFERVPTPPYPIWKY